jgi:hypothetical protein
MLKAAHLLFLALLLSAGAASASDLGTVTVEATGEAILSEALTLKDVKLEALNNARRAAIEQAVGVDVQSSFYAQASSALDYDIAYDVVTALAEGSVVHEEVLGRETENMQSGTGEPFTLYRVRIRAEVALHTGERDPAFRVIADLGRVVFKHGDPVSVKVSVTQDAYLYLFTITEDGKAYMIFPHRFNQDNHVTAGEAFVFPSERDVARGMRLVAGLLPSSDRASESFKVIATKRPIAFIPGLFTEGIGIEAFAKDSGTMQQLAREIVAIPVSGRAEAHIPYEIVK